MNTSDIISLFALLAAIIALTSQFYDHVKELKEVVEFKFSAALAGDSRKFNYTLVSLEITNKSRKDIWVKNVEHVAHFEKGEFRITVFSDDYKTNLAPNEFLTYRFAIWDKETEGLLNNSGINKTIFRIKTSSKDFVFSGVSTWPLFTSNDRIDDQFKYLGILSDRYSSLKNEGLTIPNSISLEYDDTAKS
jgi:hypothetical protein